jgi:hypothetical protein
MARRAVACVRAELQEHRAGEIDGTRGVEAGRDAEWIAIAFQRPRLHHRVDRVLRNTPTERE